MASHSQNTILRNNCETINSSVTSFAAKQPSCGKGHNNYKYRSKHNKCIELDHVYTEFQCLSSTGFIYCELRTLKTVKIAWRTDENQVRNYNKSSILFHRIIELNACLVNWYIVVSDFVINRSCLCGVWT